MYDFRAGIIAGLLVQNTLKYLLNFGTVTQYLGYASLRDFFPQMQIRANPGCLNPLCVRLQAQYKVRHTGMDCPAADGQLISL